MTENYKDSQCGLLTLINTLKVWEASQENKLRVGNVDESIWQELSESATSEVECIFLHIGYCDFGTKKFDVKRPVRFSYSAKEKQIRITYFLDYRIFKIADSLNPDIFVAFHEAVRLDGIVAAFKKYKIPEENYKELLERRSKLGIIPEWIPEMEDNPQLVIDMYKESVPG